jgi:hypothetical protein
MLAGSSVRTQLMNYIDCALIAGNYRYSQFAAERFDGFDGSPVSTGEGTRNPDRFPTFEIPQIAQSPEV